MLNKNILKFCMILFLSTTIVECARYITVPGQRFQYYSLNDDGSYKYAFNTGEGFAAKQKADERNEVAGRFVFIDPNGETVDVKYESGKKGFIPEGFENRIPIVSDKTQEELERDDGPQAERVYAFQYSNENSSRQESSDDVGTVQGQYSYKNEDGSYNLNYAAGAGTGFVVTGGNLAQKNKLGLVNLESGKEDGSYNYDYSTGLSSRQESKDSDGLVHGKYSYTDESGTYELSYTAGGDAGFVVTGGNLAIPNSLVTQSGAPSRPDGLYSFSYANDDSTRQEWRDAAGRVVGAYAYNNEAGTNDLSYAANSEIGFVPIGGSLATPNGLNGKTIIEKPKPTVYEESKIYATAPNRDGSYKFGYISRDAAREESRDATGKTRGSFKYINEAGQNDLRFVSSSDTGYLPIGGSLSVPNGLHGKIVPVVVVENKVNNDPLVQSDVSQTEKTKSATMDSSNKMSDSSMISGSQMMSATLDSSNKMSESSMNIEKPESQMMSATIGSSNKMSESSMNMDKSGLQMMSATMDSSNKMSDSSMSIEKSGSQMMSATMDSNNKMSESSMGMVKPESQMMSATMDSNNKISEPSMNIEKSGSQMMPATMDLSNKMSEQSMIMDKSGSQMMSISPNSNSMSQLNSKSSIVTDDSGSQTISYKSGTKSGYLYTDGNSANLYRNYPTQLKYISPYFSNPYLSSIRGEKAPLLIHRSNKPSGN